MLKNISRLEYVIDNKIYHFTCDNDAPLAHVKDALLKFVQYVGQVEDQVRANQEAAAKQAEEKAKEEVPAEVA